MYVSKISAKDFRNLCVNDIQLSPNINIFYGNNAQGKTNFLEAVYFCAFGRSLRVATDKELIAFEAESAHIRAEIVRGTIRQTQDVYIEKQGLRASKRILVDRVPVRHMKDLFGRLLVVMFTPEDLRLIKAGPAERRRFIDMEICQLSPVYYSDLREYYRALKQRNALLKILQKDKSQIDSLSIWDEQLVRFGKKIIKTRTNFIERLNEISKEIHSHISQEKEDLTITYAPSITGDYLPQMQKNHNRDIMHGITNCGIHKDDLTFTINGISAKNFGSQGQQRTAALSTKLAEIEIIKKSTGETPVLLLDDVLSELDKTRQKFLLSKISNLQTIITCTGVEDILGEIENCFYVENGGITKTD